MLFHIINILIITLTTPTWGATIQYSSMPKPDCNHTNYMPDEKCCLVPNIYTEELMEKCSELIEDSSTNMDLSNSFFEYCFKNCVINETKIMADDGALNEDNMSNYVNEVFADTPDMIPVVEESFRECFGVTNISRQYIQPNDKCPIQIALIMDCLYTRIFMFCADSVWTNTETCNNARAYSDKCMPKYLYMNME